METETTALEGVVVLTPRRFSDSRGFFSEVWNAATLRAHGIAAEFVQDNQSLSVSRGTVRGLHYQTPPHAQAKLVRCGRGAVWDVVVDIRRGSPTFGRWFGVELTAENGRQIFVPEGFLHGFSTLTDDAEVLYKCSAPFAPECDRAIRYDSPSLAIDWRLDGVEPRMSDKDATAPLFDAAEFPFVMETP